MLYTLGQYPRILVWCFFVHISFVLSFVYSFLADLRVGYREAPLGRQGTMIGWRSTGRGWDMRKVE